MMSVKYQIISFKLSTKSNFSLVNFSLVNQPHARPIAHAISDKIYFLTLNIGNNVTTLRISRIFSSLKAVQQKAVCNHISPSFISPKIKFILYYITSTHNYLLQMSSDELLFAGLDEIDTTEPDANILSLTRSTTWQWMSSLTTVLLCQSSVNQERFLGLQVSTRPMAMATATSRLQHHQRHRRSRPAHPVQLYSDHQWIWIMFSTRKLQSGRAAHHYHCLPTCPMPVNNAHHCNNVCLYRSIIYGMALVLPSTRRACLHWSATCSMSSVVASTHG